MTPVEAIRYLHFLASREGLYNLDAMRVALDTLMPAYELSPMDAEQWLDASADLRKMKNGKCAVGNMFVLRNFFTS